MFEAYSIGVTLKLNNLISPQLLIISQEFTKLEAQATAVGAVLKKIGAEAAGLKSVAAAGNASSVALDRASRSASAFERHLASVRAAAAGLGTLPNMPVLPGGGAGGGGHGGGGRYGRGGFHGGNVHMGPGGIGIGTVGLAAGGAFVPLAITAGALYAGHALYESAKDLDTERARFRQLGLSGAQNAEAFNFVDKMRVFGSSKAENMRNFREAQGVFRESGLEGSEALEGAKLAAPVLAKLNLLAKAFGGENAEKLQTANMAMLRYVELSGGLKNAETFNRIADFGYRLNVSSGGTVDWQQLLAFKKTAGVAGYHLTDDALARLEPIMAELGGGRAGTADMTSYNRVTGITRVPNQVAHMLADMGVWDKSKISWNANGGIKNITGNPLGEANTKLLSENPELFYEQVIRPIYTKMRLSSEEIARQNAAIFGRTGGQFFTAIERALPQIHASVDALNKAAGIEKSMAEARKAVSGQEQEFQAAWTDFKAAAGTTLLPFFSGLLKAGAGLFRHVEANKDMLANVMSLNPIGAGIRSSVGFMKWLISDSSETASPAKSTVATKASGTPQMTGTVMLDGRKVGSFFADHLARESGRPQTGATSFDARLALGPVGGY